MSDKVTLEACPPGLFWFDDGKRSGLGIKTQYETRASDGTLMPDAFLVETGEYFWGGTEKPEVRGRMLVTPVDYEYTMLMVSP